MNNYILHPRHVEGIDTFKLSSLKKKGIWFHYSITKEKLIKL